MLARKFYNENKKVIGFSIKVSNIGLKLYKYGSHFELTMDICIDLIFLFLQLR